MTIKGIMTSTEGHVTKFEKVSLGTSSRSTFNGTHKIWWNLVQKRLRNQPGQTDRHTHTQTHRHTHRQTRRNQYIPY